MRDFSGQAQAPAMASLPLCPKCGGRGFTLRQDLERIPIVISFRYGVACDCPAGKHHAELQQRWLSMQPAEELHATPHPGHEVKRIQGHSEHYRNPRNPEGECEQLVCDCGFEWRACRGFAWSSLRKSAAECGLPIVRREKVSRS